MAAPDEGKEIRNPPRASAVERPPRLSSHDLSPSPCFSGRIGRVRERLRLPGGEPVLEAQALGSHAHEVRDAVGQLKEPQVVVGGFEGQLAPA